MDEKQDDDGRRFSWVDLGFIFFVGVFLGDAVGFPVVGFAAICIVVLTLCWLFITRPAGRESYP